MKASSVHTIVDENRWLQLGLGGTEVPGIHDSDDENENDDDTGTFFHAVYFVVAN